MKIHTLISFIFLLLLIDSVDAIAQFQVTNTASIPALRNGKTYIVMKDPESEIASKYVEVFKKYWTISEIEFINYDEIGEHIEEGKENTFFMMGWKAYVDQGIVGKQNYLELWSAGIIPGNGKKSATITQTEIAKIYLMSERGNIKDPHLFDTLEYDYEGRIPSWGPGILKNSLQRLMVLLESEKIYELKNPILNQNDLGELKTKTLFIPEFLLRKPKPMHWDGVTVENKALESYTYQHEIMAAADLNNKILNDKTYFYYLSYSEGPLRFINIINAATGEIIYCTGNMAIGLNNIRESDVKILLKKISAN